MDLLPLPANITEDARTAFFEADRSGIIQDYARVDMGETTSDGFIINESTDAEAVMLAATGEKNRLFIQLPTNEARREHILRSIASAAIREDLTKGDVWNIVVLNTRAIKSNISNFGFDDHDAKNYFLAIAKKLNNQLSGKDVLVVNIDDFGYGLNADEFFAILPTPHLVALSKRTIDTVKYFDNKTQSDEFLSKGLNPGHVYLLTKARVLRSKSITDPADQEKIAMMVAKTITALEPSGNLGSLNKFFTLAEPIIDSPTPIANLDAEILRTLAAFFQASYDYLVELQLENKTLTEINDQVKENALAFSEQSRKTNEILHNISKILASGTGALGEAMARGFHATRSDLDDLRTTTLPGIERTLLDSVDRTRDEVVGQTKQAIRNATDSVVKDAKDKHEKTELAVRKNVSAIVAEAQSKISQDSRGHVTEQANDIKDHVAQAVRKIMAENRGVIAGVTEGINTHTTDAVKQMQRLLVDALTEAEAEIKKQITEEIIQGVDERIRNAIARIVLASNDNAKATQSAADAVVIKESKLTREQLTAVDVEIRKLVQEESELILDGISKLPNKAKMSGLLTSLARLILAYAARVPIIENDPIRNPGWFGWDTGTAGRIAAERDLKSISEATNPNIQVGNAHETANRVLDTATENQIEEDLYQHADDLLDQLYKILENPAVEEE